MSRITYYTPIVMKTVKDMYSYGRKDDNEDYYIYDNGYDYEKDENDVPNEIN